MTSLYPLADRMTPCGSVLDAKVSERVLEALARVASGWSASLYTAWPALAPAFAASPYLSALARRDAAGLGTLLASTPEAALAGVLAGTLGLSHEPDPEAVKRGLRRAKARLHLLTALCDLGGVWDLDAVTGALTRFADASLQAALHAAARIEAARGRLVPPPKANEAGNEAKSGESGAGPVPGLFCLALGKHGAFELNYSSDIDVSIFYAPEALPAAPGVEPQALALRLTQHLIDLLQTRTEDGYVHRVDLRLRPDPSSTPAAVPVEAALDYYESVGQNWERAAMIKARVAAGDRARGAAFLAELQPFVWRRNLDYAAIADIQSIKRQIHVHHDLDRETLKAAGANLKLGAGGIREIEFFVQTQQLILGGRQPALRSPRTLDALAALVEAGQVTPAAAAELKASYEALRAFEHRIQMVHDEQTHVLPEAAAERRAVAALSGYGELRAFDARVVGVLKTVNRRYGELFAAEEPLSSRFGSLVFTGVDDDPETLETLARMGFSNPAQVSAAIQSWHHGRIAATRTERGRELFTRLAPRLLEAVQATGAADIAFNRFTDFFARLASGVQVQSLFLAEPKLFKLVVEVLAFAPRLAATLAQKPAVLDALLDPNFFAPLDETEVGAGLRQAVAEAEDFEAAMDAARRAHREEAFRIGVQVISRTAGARAAGHAFAALADACISALAPKALEEVERQGGAFPGSVAVVALGKAGSREMNARSDLDLMTLYAGDTPDAMSAAKGWSVDTFYSRFTQRLVAALSVPTAEGPLYEVDLRLRPSGAAGPVAVSLAAFESYYAGEAETWEFLAMTRARVVWASTRTFGERATAAIEAALRRPRDPVKTARDVLEMRRLMARERPPSGAWDLKLSEGGLVDIEFAAQYLQIVHAGEGGPLNPDTAAALQAFQTAGLGTADDIDALTDAFGLQQDLTQVMKLALTDDADPEAEPGRLRAILAEAGGARDFRGLKALLKRRQGAARLAYRHVVDGR